MSDVPMPEVPVVDTSRDEASENDVDSSQPMRELSSDKGSLGNMLVQARLQVGLTQEQVAKELYVTVSKVKALEADDYSRLSSDTFARGYIRAYANLVKVDVVVLLTAYDALMEQLQPEEVTSQKPLSTATETSHRGAWQFLVLIGIFFIALWLISVWFFDNHSDDQYIVTLASVSSSIGAISSEVSSSVAVSEVSESDGLAVASAPIANGFGSASSNPALSAQVVAQASGTNVSYAAVSSATVVESVMTESSGSVKKTSLDELSFSFREESWLEVSDSRGDVLATELQPAGSKLKLLGFAPFDVKIGNAPAVDISLNGRKMDVIPLMGTNVLTLKINN